MKISRNIDWLKASKEDRAKLYVILRAISDLTGQSLEELMEEAFGYKLLTGADYLSNFRRGGIARAKAKLIAVWIAERYNDTAHTIAPDLFPENEITDWNGLIPSIAIKGKLDIIRAKDHMGLVQRDDDDQDINQRLKLGEKFYFQLDSDIAGYGIAYQGYRGEWHPLPLGANPNDMLIPITKGGQILPRHPNNKPINLSENEDSGIHMFVIIVADTIEKLPDAPNGQINACHLYLNQVTFSLNT